MNDKYIEGLRINWDKIPNNSYVRKIKALNNITEFIFKSNITFFVGENGSGKSTILEGIAQEYGFNKEGGSKNYNFKTFDESSPLMGYLDLYKGYKKSKNNYFFRAETFFNVASKEVEYAIGVESEEYHNKSHGEAFLHLFKKLTKSDGLFLLDEPEAALSPQRQLALFSLIYDASKMGSQFIIVTHSPILLAIPDSKIYEFNDEGIKEINYEDSDSYKITSMFINHKEVMIDELTKE